MPDYGKIIGRSIAVVKKNKWLLVYGLLLAGSGGSSGGGGGSSSGSSSNNSSINDTLNKLKGNQYNFEDVPGKVKEVLGTFTSSLLDWFHQVPITTWLWLVLGILLAILVAVVIGYVFSNWARGSMITGVAKALKDEEVNLTNTSPAGIKVIAPLISLSVWIALIVLGISIGLVGIWSLFYLLFKNVAVLNTIIAVIGAFGLLDLILFILIFIPMVNMYAERLIVLHGFSPRAAIKKGFSLSKNGFFATFVMGLINFIAGMTVGCGIILLAILFLGIPAYIFAYPSIKNRHLPGIGNISILVLIVVLFFILIKIVGAVISVFKYANWQQLFDEIYEKVQPASETVPQTVVPVLSGNIGEKNGTK